ncbi:UvrB/UvrC motif-containing protein [Rossellomorea aquimaris]|uniref:UvrB/UvrC motif-containing protein n=1 Tax=Rossellomorea aquimaris TaxID=189382 RepID=UPI001CD5394B|nr:UvrB/UvrC motif-containing protein [Rossellomorea aquimaris]MCA1057174.1 UvrB/UvrC motif-containing protein [Rossellomorea aquimaris]
MICQECNERPATLHFTKVVNGEKNEVHLCEHCAQDKGDQFMFDSSPGFSVNNLLAGLLNISSPAFKQAKASEVPRQEVLKCEKCNMTFQQFINVGRFGCSQCYGTFKSQLDPILKRVHSGNVEHHGKIPERMGGTIHIKKKILQLRSDLQDAIEQEEFEQAVEIRDKIRSLEKEVRDERGDAE